MFKHGEVEQFLQELQDARAFEVEVKEILDNDHSVRLRQRMKK